MISSVNNHRTINSIVKFIHVATHIKMREKDSRHGTTSWVIIISEVGQLQRIETRGKTNLLHSTLRDKMLIMILNTRCMQINNVRKGMINHVYTAIHKNQTLDIHIHFILIKF